MNINMKETDIQYIEEMRKIIVREKGDFFWKKMVGVIEESQRENFLEGYKYAISLLEDGLVNRGR